MVNVSFKINQHSILAMFSSGHSFKYMFNWSRLNLSLKASNMGMVLLIYSFWAGWAVYFGAAALGASKMFPIASQNKVGTPAVEGIIGIFMLSFVITFLISFIILLKGLSREKK